MGWFACFKTTVFPYGQITLSYIVVPARTPYFLQINSFVLRETLNCELKPFLPSKLKLSYAPPGANLNSVSYARTSIPTAGLKYKSYIRGFNLTKIIQCFYTTIDTESARTSKKLPLVSQQDVMPQKWLHGSSL